MKGFITKTALLYSAVLGSVGCYGYRDLVDPCYPERYWSSSRHLEEAAFAPQVQNGEVLDQTVWNYYFERLPDGTPTASLNAMGLDQLARMARRRPAADPLIFLQTAQDIGYDATAPDRMSAERLKLDGDRIAAVQKFLGAQTAGRPVAFQVQVHDPSEVGLAATPVNNTIQQNNARFTGGLRIGGGASTSGGAASSGASSGGR